MKFSLIIDDSKEEEVIVSVHQRTALIDDIEALVLAHTGADTVCGYTENSMKVLPFSQIECIIVLNGKVYAIDCQNMHYRLKQRLYELEEILPSSFIRINKSALANEKQLDHFSVTYSGAVDAVFKCGYREYVSRRCFAQIRRRFEAR